METPALIIIEKRETMEFMLTICGQSGRGRFWCAMRVTMSPISDSKANMQLHVSAVQPFLHIRSIALVNAVQPRAIPRGITIRAPRKPAKHPREPAVLLFSD